MERQDFLPRAVFPGNDGLRDLPPTDSAPGGLTHGDHTPMVPSPEPRMESFPEGGCGCGGHHGEDEGICVGYEGCGEGSWGLTNHPPAMVYAPCQVFRALYDPDTALNRGTLFTELDLPFGGAEGTFTAVGCACRVERRGV